MQKVLLLGASIAVSLLPMTAMSEVFADPAVDYATQSGIMFVGSDGQFDPTGNVTRLEFTLATVDLLYPQEDMEGCFAEIGSSPGAQYSLLFGDVARDEWYGPRLCVAMRAGLIQGDKNGNFRPFSYITNAEASKILARGYGLLYPPMNPTSRQWFEGPMLAMTLRGAIGSQVAPYGKLSRHGMADMFYALRDTERFPIVRVIGSQQPSTSMPTDAMTGTPTTPATATSVTDAETIGDCAITHINSPGAALLMLGIEAHPRALPFRSHRSLRDLVEMNYQNGDFTGPNGGLPLATVQDCGGVKNLTNTNVPRTINTKPSNRMVRAYAEQRGNESGRFVDPNVGY